ncbi:MAG: hypothetical protein IH577_04570 [Deltaproteobacteria bacterium]|nr:hypothetical protein [Deltaproteobacteria bacterium]
MGTIDPCRFEPPHVRRRREMEAEIRADLRDNLNGLRTDQSPPTCKECGAACDDDFCSDECELLWNLRDDKFVKADHELRIQKGD